MLSSCPKCNQPIEAGANCPACLMQLGMLDSGSGRARAAEQTEIPSIEQVAAQFSQLDVIRNIGRGGMGAIYLARQNSLERNVALKLLTTEASSDQAFIDRFEREARALAMLSHPNIVTVFDFGRTGDGIPFLIMEYVEGANLRQAIAARRMSSAEAVELMLSISKAIEFAHSKGVLHRDLKPENILLGADGAVKVADFGIAKILNDPIQRSTLTATRQVLGSPHYLAPEQLEAPDQVDHRIDLYALGVIFYELLTTQMPLGLFEAPSKLSSDLDPRLDSVVLKLLHRNPAQRYQTVTEFLNDLRQFSASEPHTGRAPNRPGTTATSVPFSAESHGGLAEAKGMLHVTPAGILVEFIVVDAIFGGIKSDLKQVEISRENLSKVTLVRGVFKSKLCITSNSMSAISQLPNGETGQAKLTVKNADIELAHEVIASLGFSEPKESKAARVPLSMEYFPTQAILVMLCGILNGGLLAVVLTALATLKPFAHPELAIVSISVVFGLLILVQVACSFVHLVSGLQSPWRVALLASVIPITPVFFLSLPIALWWWLQLQNPRSSGITNPGGIERPSWTATTMIYLRENRTARLISLLNLAGIVLFVAGTSVFYSGWVPTTARFRVVTVADNEFSAAGEEVLQDRVLSRLDGIPGAKIITDSKNERLEIRCWKRHLSEVKGRLEIGRSPELVLIPDGKWKDIASPSQSLPIQEFELANGLDFSESQRKGAGNKVECLISMATLQEQWVKNLDRLSDPKTGIPLLRCTWSGPGRTSFDRFVSEAIGEELAEIQWQIGLVVDRIVLAKAPLLETSNQYLDFSFPSEWTLSPESVMASVRGPNLGVELEFLE